MTAALTGAAVVVAAGLHIIPNRAFLVPKLAFEMVSLRTFPADAVFAAVTRHVAFPT